MIISMLLLSAACSKSDVLFSMPFMLICIIFSVFSGFVCEVLGCGGGGVGGGVFVFGFCSCCVSGCG